VWPEAPVRHTAGVAYRVVHIGGDELHRALVLVMMPRVVAWGPFQPGEPVRRGEVGGPVAREMRLDGDSMGCVRREVRVPVVGEAHAVRVLPGQFRRPLVPVVNPAGVLEVGRQAATRQPLHALWHRPSARVLPCRSASAGGRSQGWRWRESTTPN
jgi:hypothetical protein